MEIRQKSSHADEINCYIEAMSRQSAKSTGRSTKTARPAAAKSAKKTSKATSARAPARNAPAKKPAKASASAKSARRSAAKDVRTTPATITRAPSVAPAAPRIIRTPSPPTQPMVPEPPVRSHRYQVGETVFYTSPSFGRAAATGSYTVVKLLPSEGDDYQYRIKSSGEAFERVAKESQLDKA